MTGADPAAASGTEEAARAARGGPKGREGALVATVALGSMLAPLNSTMIAVALPRIIAGFHAGVATAAWLVTMYLIAMGTLQPVAGKLGDRLGRRRMILTGMALFALSSLGAALSGDLLALFVFRALQAASGAVALPNGTALLGAAIPQGRRGARFGLVGSATSTAAAVGPALGGVLVGLADWRAIFLVNVLILVPALIVGWRALPPDGPPPPGRPFDVGGAVALPAVLAGLAVALGRIGAGTARAARLLPAGGAAVAVALGLLLWHESRHPDPVLQPRFFARRSFAAATAAVCLSNLAMYSTLLAVPLLLAGRPGWTSARVGVVLAALSALTAACAPAGGRLADRFGRRWPTLAGLVLFAAGLAPLAGGAWNEAATLVACLACAGAGLGLAGSGMQTAALEAVPPRQAGAAAGAYSASRYLGSIAGSSVLAALVAPAVGRGGEAPVFILVALAAAASALAAALLEDRPREA